MKRLLLLFTLFASLVAPAQQTYKGLPLINATNDRADYRVDAMWVKGNWRIAPEAVPDVLMLPMFSRTIQFGFYTDVDSLVFTTDASQVKQFYVHTADNQYALTEVRGFNYEPINFDATVKEATYKSWYENGSPNTFLTYVKTQYALEDVIKGLTSDSARALRILKWTHDQWKHNGDNEPTKRDALTILKEAKEGKQFRCVEYGIVASTALNAIGLPARVMGLKTKDVETTEYGAGHVLLEVWLRDMKKWVLLDGQWDAMPVLNNIPLNAVEFQQAIVQHYDGLTIRSLSGTPKDQYCAWVYPYLYYFDVAFDNREGLGLVREQQDGKPSLMLVPLGAKAPTVFQKKRPINNAVYTHSLRDFYAAPF